LAWILVRQLLVCQAAKLFVHDRHKLIGSLRIARVDPLQKPRYVAHRPADRLLKIFFCRAGKTPMPASHFT
jgi:hypothetical protein